ncbi:hypothetical protein [Acidovorax sp.]|uniref:hypothetical protein n=1 Tax=Acidovorax sp. TaxID=1872122 RepID=UPI0039E32DE8
MRCYTDHRNFGVMQAKRHWRNALTTRINYTNDAVFDNEDFAVAEDVQLGLIHGANNVHTLGLEEGLLAIFQQGIDRAMSAAPICDSTMG